MASPSEPKYEFIVVGAGPAGCVIAWRLASSAARPKVLLIEAGGDNAGTANRVDAERWIHRMSPGQNWGYQSIPQEHLGGTVIPLDRGKGLGGSSAINFSCWTIGPKDDHDEIAELVGDDEWKWSNAQPRYKRIETYHAPSGLDGYLEPNLADHGHQGPLNIGFPATWERTLEPLLESGIQYGMKKNVDPNNGEPIGMGIVASTAYSGHRTTAADFLVGAPSNLHVLTSTQVARVIFEGQTAVGVETLESANLFASKEVILSCGSLDTPKILMHSGIGPEDQLNKYGIQVLQHNANVGQHMMDHHHLTLNYLRADHTTTRHTYYRSKQLQAAARAQWEKDGTGPLSEIGTGLGIAYLKLDRMYETKEFQELDAKTQAFLKRPNVPLWELLVNGASPAHFIDPENAPAMTTMFIFVMNTQSRGTVTLQSSRPEEPLVYDEGFFSHPYDRRLAIEMTREALKFVESPAFSKDTVGVLGPELPASASEEQILDAWRKGTGSTWHMSGTARMGRNAETAVVDNTFRVFGVDKLRISDMSVYPLLPNNHTQTSAYLVGLMLGDKLVDEYHLE
ncbi:uncharacterized protein HMPREF1541_02647 [Cyphellophora europaea CBS 101466]|uniref:Glucose-methanol-choline oxidoreductase N-terminal domain-containing protein n=1 Tax=Cyphellophora europaea (strain CBS 101466) TaxID=1220924 RepID=W2S630_CYPE1|nr:uncharacterized protein HMPREF1541_02647 [Cyphellophora europaea CBS 101466]ETN43488.1 hypothetical protein HMPREF1541_02647 [Cyphellophora europaea CBS 101466]